MEHSMVCVCQFHALSRSGLDIGNMSRAETSVNATCEKGLRACCIRRGTQERGLKKQGSTCSPELNLPLKLRPAFKAASTSFKHFSMVSSSLRAAVSLPLGPPRMALTCPQAVQAVLSDPSHTSVHLLWLTLVVVVNLAASLQHMVDIII